MSKTISPKKIYYWFFRKTLTLKLFCSPFFVLDHYKIIPCERCRCFDHNFFLGFVQYKHNYFDCPWKYNDPRIDPRSTRPKLKFESQIWRPKWLKQLSDRRSEHFFNASGLQRLLPRRHDAAAAESTSLWIPTPQEARAQSARIFPVVPHAPGNGGNGWFKDGELNRRLHRHVMAG